MKTNEKERMKVGKRSALICILFALMLFVIPAMDLHAASTNSKVKSVTIKIGKKNVTKKNVELTVDEKATIKVSVKPAKAKKKISFKSDAPSVVSVSKKGKMTAKKEGSAKITVTVKDKAGKTKKTYVKVTVKGIEPQNLTAKISKSELYIGETAQVQTTITPWNATDKQINYTSSNNAVATVNQSGLVTACGEGVAIITAATANRLYQNMLISVKNKVIEVKEVKIEVVPSTNIQVGESAKINASTEPENAVNTGFKYVTSNNNVAVDAMGNVKGVAVGECEVTVSASNGVSKKIDFTVEEKIEEIVEKQLTISYTNTESEAKDVYGTLYAPGKEGKYPLVILSHGFNGTGNDFVNECRYFAQNGFVAYAYDFCGGSVNSRSSGATTDMTIFSEKEDLKAVYNHLKELDNVDSGQVFLFGGSMGGLVSALTAADMPNQIKGMVLYFPALNVPDDWRATFPNESDIPNVHNLWGMNLGKEFFTSIREFNPYDYIGNYKKNVLIIYGMKDTIVPFKYMTQAQESYANEQMILYSNEGHGFSEKSQEAMEQALYFMKKQ